MEKFTVDLDKVLDEFEFNEEQAIRHALQHFKREDLPATKYQKPHFKPINIADADFGPCIETTMSYSGFRPAVHSQESGDFDATTIVHKINDAEYLVAGNDLDSSINNNSNNNNNNNTEEARDGCQVLDTNVEKAFVLNDEGPRKVTSDQKDIEGQREEREGRKIDLEEISITPWEKKDEEQTEKVKGDMEIENKSVKIEYNGREKLEIPDEEKGPANDCDRVREGVEAEKKEVAMAEKEKAQIAQLLEKVKKEKENMEKVEEEVENGVEKEEEEEKKQERSTMEEEKKNQWNQQTLSSVAEYPEGRESRHKPDLIENESLDSDSSDLKIKIGKQLPDLTEVSPQKSTERDSKESDRLTSKQNEKETKVEVEAEVEVKGEGEAGPATDSTVESTPVVPVEDAVVEVAPIQFDSQVDITDEELQKYLEELEEEEELEKKKTGAEAKPARPDSLNLDERGLTPPPWAGEGEEASRFKETDPRDEVTDAEKNCLDSSEEGEAPLGTSSASVSPGTTEPPLTIGECRLGKVSPFWMPDHWASNCMECDSKFTVIKRRHHCRSCGRILCSKCCGMRASLEYLQNQEQRVCEPCFRTLAKVMMYELQNENESSPKRRPNPNNPMEYCSTVPPPLQVSGAGTQPPPSVLVPVGVLKREGSSKVKENPKQVMFSDGIRPGGDLTELDGSGDFRNPFRKSGRASKRAGTPPGNAAPPSSAMLPPMDPASQSFVLEKGLPPICIVNKGETTYEENWSLAKIMERLRDSSSPPLRFAINRNLSATVKIVKLDCCMKETCWVICSKGMGCVGQDEIIVLLTLKGEEDDELPKEIFLQFHYIYKEAARGNTVNELGHWCVKEASFLGSKQHGGFLFVRPTFQCLNRIDVPPPPFLFGILIHRSEIPWARVFPFRLMLRLGAEFRYYPCPLVSVRFREPVYYEVGHTIINLLADFRNLSYTLPSVRGLRIHMEANQTSILIPRNRYDQVVRALNNSNDPVLALAGNFSPDADAHLVCMQSKGTEITYSTQAININDKPRKVTGASFVVLNGALKTTSGVAAKSSIVEDGLMVQVPSDTMTALRTKLRNMEDWSVCCGPVEGRSAEEVVRIVWCEDDKNFNVGVKSVIDNMPLDGVPSIRVHSGRDYMGCTKFIRWTQVFIIKCEDGVTSAKIGDPLEVNKLSESIAKASCLALTKLLELLSASGLTVLAVRATIDQDNVGYEAGSNGEKLAPIYMNSLDNELIPVLHKAASLNDSVAVLELIFHVMDQ